MSLTNYLKTLADTFRSKLGTTDTINAQDFPTKINEVYDAGKQDEYDIFWDAFQQNGEPMSYYYAFAYRWNDDNYNPKYPIYCNGDNAAAMNLFRGSVITDTKVPIYADASIQAAFYECRQLKTIRTLVLKETTNIATAFYRTNALEDIAIEGVIGIDFDVRSCPLLTKESIESIINALSSTQTTRTLTLRLTAVNNAFETAEGLADGSTSEEWLALVNSKTNWTITLA